MKVIEVRGNRYDVVSDNGDVKIYQDEGPLEGGDRVLCYSGRLNVADARARARAAEDAANGDAADVHEIETLLAEVYERTLDVPPRRAILVRASEVVEQPISFLWRGRIVRGTLTLLEGDPEAGKTTLAMSLLAKITRGQPLPDDVRFRSPMKCLILGAEDGMADVLTPRLRVAGADLDLVTFLKGVLSAGCDDETALKLPADLAVLRDIIVKEGIEVVYVDLLLSIAAAGTDTNSDSKVEAFMGPLAKLARDLDICIIATRHHRKSKGRKALHSGSGSYIYSAIARSILAVIPDPDDKERRILARAKCNVARPVPSVAFRITSDGEDAPAVVQWEGTDDRTADQLLEAHAEKDSGDGTPASSGAEAALRGWLKDGLPKDRQMLEELAEHAGMSWRKVQRVAERIGVSMGRTSSFPSRTTWQLPAQTSVVPTHSYAIDVE